MVVGVCIEAAYCVNSNEYVNACNVLQNLTGDFPVCIVYSAFVNGDRSSSFNLYGSDYDVLTCVGVGLFVNDLTINNLEAVNCEFNALVLESDLVFVNYIVAVCIVSTEEFDVNGDSVGAVYIVQRTGCEERRSQQRSSRESSSSSRLRC